MEENKKKKLINIALWVGLAVLILFVLITSIIVHSRKTKLEDLNDKNDLVKTEQSIVRIVEIYDK